MIATSADTVPCSICREKKQTNVSKSWCPECEDALCPGCDEHHGLSKGTRNHKIIPIDDYVKLPSFIFNIKLVCEEHDEKFQNYCKNHEIPLCKKCIATTHNTCKDIAVLDDVTSNIKTSYTLEAIQRDTEDIFRRIKEMQDDRQLNCDKIRQQKSNIIKEISEVRTAINQHLDKIKNEVLTKLDSKTERHFKSMEDFITKLKDKENQITKMKTNLSKIIKYASDFQTFLGIKQIEKQVHTVDEFIKSSCDDGNLNQVEIGYAINKDITDITERIRKFGDITVKSTSAIIDLNSFGENQAQLFIAKKTMYTEKRLKLLRRLDVFKSDVRTSCCCLMSNGDMVFGHEDDTISLYTKDGTKGYKIELPYLYPVDITIVDDETIAVSAGGKIILIDTGTRNIITVDIGYGIWGITFTNGSVIYCEKDKGVNMIDLQTFESTLLLKDKLSLQSHITAFGTKSRKFVLSELSKKTVRVFDSNMKELWRLSDTDYLQNPYNVFADRDNFLYVDDGQSIVCISPDGQNHYVLKSDDCTFKMDRMSLNSLLGQLLVVTDEMEVLVFSI